MKREDIYKAASDYAEENSWYPGETSYESDIIAIEESFADAFKAGAEWRINSVWHDASEVPDTDKGDLIIIVKDAFGKDVYVRQNAYYVLKYGCVKWAYMKDLLPIKED